MTSYKVSDLACEASTIRAGAAILQAWRKPCGLCAWAITAHKDVNTSPSSTPAEPNNSMLDEAVMDRTYYMGLQSTQPAALPVPLEDNPLHVAGPSDNLEGVTDIMDAANAAAAAAAANFNMNPAPALGFHPQANALPAAPPAMAVPVRFRPANRTRKQKVLSARQKDLLHEEWRAEKDKLEQLEEEEKKRQKRQQALAAARAAAKVTAEARKAKAQAQQQKAAATRQQRAAMAAAAAAAAARNGEAAASGAAAGRVTAAASSAAAGGEAAGASGMGLGAMGASARGNGGAAPPLTQPTGRALTRRRVPNRKFLHEVSAAEGLMRNSPVKATKGRSAHQRALTRLHYMRLPLSSAGHLLTALESGPAAPLSPPRVWMRFRMANGVSPGGSHAVGPSTKASGSGAPTWRKGSIAPFVDMVLCNACGIFEARHGKSLLECTEPVRVNRSKAEYNALYGDKAASGGDSDNNGSGHASGGGTVSSRDSGSDSDRSGGGGVGPENGSSGGDSRTGDGRDEVTASQVLAGLRNAEAPGPSVQRSSSQRERNASFGESTTTVGQQLTTDPLRQSDSGPLSSDCARALSHHSLQDNSGSASVALTRMSKKRAAEVSCAEPDAKRGSSGGQGSSAAGGAIAFRSGIPAAVLKEFPIAPEGLQQACSCMFGTFIIQK
ncbi:hypothetical protein WJX82_005202 [Trebouxia sp. C0006]